MAVSTLRACLRVVEAHRETCLLRGMDASLDLYISQAITADPLLARWLEEKFRKKRLE